MTTVKKKVARPEFLFLLTLIWKRNNPARQWTRGRQQASRPEDRHVPIGRMSGL
jgi:hypothetical protein